MIISVIDPDDDRDDKLDELFRQMFGDKSIEKEVATSTVDVEQEINGQKYVVTLEFGTKDDSAFVKIVKFEKAKTNQQLIDQYRLWINDSVIDENYEQAAIYRDIIKDLERGQ